MIDLVELAAQLRAAGIQSLALTLSDAPAEPPHTPTDERQAEPEPGATHEPKSSAVCAYEGCGEPRAGLFGGTVGGKYCREHAALMAGAR